MKWLLILLLGCGGTPEDIAPSETRVEISREEALARELAEVQTDLRAARFEIAMLRLELEWCEGKR